jgi:two-component system sensor histidine kinase BaeS
MTGTSRDRRGAGRPRRADRTWRRGPRHGAGAFGCLVLALVLFVGMLTALATWVAGAVLGLVAPGAAPSPATAVSVIVVVVVALVLGGRMFGSAVGPLAELASATERLADGEPDVRVAVRGPRPVRGLVSSFNTMAARLDRTRADRQALLADVTHELRTPLTVIGGGIEAILDGIHPADEDHLAPILAETRVMDRLLDDLRTLSLAEAGALPLHREPADLVELAADVLAAQRPVATAAGVELRASGDASLDVVVDPVRVREILANLVGNALRHTPAGGSVTVEVRGDGDHALAVVRDTGEGIPPADLERVFTRFHRRSDTGGSGLGLTIARDLAAAHGGTIAAASDGIPGHGTTFTVRLPLGR